MTDEELYENFADAIWNSFLLVFAAAFGHAAIYVCDDGRKQIIEMEHIRTNRMDVDSLLRQLPESISKTIHQTTTPHGTSFQALMLVAALLILHSEFPKHEFVRLGVSIRSIGFEVSRCLCPVVGILTLIFIPMSHDFIVMTERFKKPGYQITREDKAAFYANKLQEDMHTAAGALSFVMTPVLEGYAIGRGYVEFFGSGIGEDYVAWHHRDGPSYMWLALLIARTLMLVGTNVCLWNMIYEWYCEPTARCTRNPYYIYNTEKGLIRQLLNYILLMGMSMWFVNSRQFKLIHTLTQGVLMVLASVAVSATVLYTLGNFWYLLRKDAFLNDYQMEKILRKLVTKTEERMDKYTDELVALQEKWAKCYAEPDVDDESASSDGMLQALCGGGAV
mmetsp:Transcript_12046/g.22697  ORF Transcript_12046/g.22697 Transcript_12046/m.22697 type:complete len:391 (+) Transcript_12046:67-1239(+)